MGGLAALLLGGLLGWTGAVKLARPAPDAALAALLPAAVPVRAALRVLGAVEVALAAALLAGLPAAGWAAALLGVGFLGYLARVRDAGGSCGCTSARPEPVTARSYGRAGLVVAGGLAAATGSPWWTVVADRPAGAGLALAAGAVAVAALSADLDRWWLLPLRRSRLRLLGHPLAGSSAGVPVAATVELLETSLAWHRTAGVVRSALLESWDDGGWRFLRFAGVEGGRPVTVVFALDAAATVDTTDRPAVRVTVVGDEVLGDPARAYEGGAKLPA